MENSIFDISVHTILLSTLLIQCQNFLICFGPLLLAPDAKHRKRAQRNKAKHTGERNEKTFLVRIKLGMESSENSLPVCVYVCMWFGSFSVFTAYCPPLRLSFTRSKKKQILLSFRNKSHFPIGSLVYIFQMHTKTYTFTPIDVRTQTHKTYSVTHGPNGSNDKTTKCLFEKGSKINADEIFFLAPLLFSIWCFERDWENEKEATTTTEELLHIHTF